ncbi:MAG: Hsp20/alpha crystallin family protein [Solirubrobacteraceae bacterium]|nr:Hsp20/alpha crystallin family protein [Solirubrobacteraceae bacterium]
MAIVRWSPARELGALQRQVDDVFASWFEPTAARATTPWRPAVDLVEQDDAYVLTADLPGVRREDLVVEVEDDVLTLGGRRTLGRRSSAEGVVRLERASGELRRRIALPEGVDPDAIGASFQDGVLEVRIPKPEASRPRKVAIEVHERAPEVAAAPSSTPPGEAEAEAEPAESVTTEGTPTTA